MALLSAPIVVLVQTPNFDIPIVKRLLKIGLEGLMEVISNIDIPEKVEKSKPTYGINIRNAKAFKDRFLELVECCLSNP